MGVNDYPRGEDWTGAYYKWVDVRGAPNAWESFVNHAHHSDGKEAVEFQYLVSNVAPWELERGLVF